jgi:hypothetical protein
MTILKLSQAAKLAGKSKTTLLRALQTGRLSGKRDDAGQWTIDAAELSRVYHVAARTDACTDEVAHRAPDNEADALRRELKLMRDMLDRERELADDLRRRLDDSDGERRRLFLLLEHLPDTDRAGTKRSGLLGRLFGRK